MTEEENLKLKEINVHSTFIHFLESKLKEKHELEEKLQKVNSDIEYYQNAIIKSSHTIDEYLIYKWKNK